MSDGYCITHNWVSQVDSQVFCPYCRIQELEAAVELVTDIKLIDGKLWLGGGLLEVS